MPKMGGVTVRARAYVRAITRGQAIFGPVLLLLLLLVGTVWFGYEPGSREAAGQEKAATPAVPKTPSSTPPAAPKIAPLPKAPAPAERPSTAIPGLSVMDVVGELQYLPDTNFRCPGASPDRGLYKRVCRSSSDDEPPVVYEVTLVGEDPRTVLWVRADARDATDEATAEFFGYVARLSLEDTDPLNAETWLGQNISSAGGYSAEGAELKLYGIEGARTLEIVATGLPSDIVPELSDRSRPKDRDRSSR
jgi:hypothetical protein